MSFGERALAYDTYRPGYPDEALDWLFSGAVRDVRDVADVGAGTGILTRQLVERGLAVTAVEPDGRMLEHLGRTTSSVRLVRSSAEAIDLEDDSVDATTVGQAFHWFDAAIAASEFSRIVRPGGVVGVLANLRDERVEWLREISKIVGGADWSQSNRDDVAASMAELFPFVQRREFTHAVAMAREDVIGLVGTFSYVRLRDDVDQVNRDVRAVLENHEATKTRPTIPVPYVTVVFRAVVPD